MTKQHSRGDWTKVTDPPGFARAVPFRVLRHLVLLLSFAVADAHAQLPVQPLQALVDRACQSTLDQFRARKLGQDQFAVTVVDLRDPLQPRRASVRGDVPIYPASVIKLFYLA